ncbi:unnamed protein product [Camellia sinensis]
MLRLAGFQVGWSEQQAYIQEVHNPILCLHASSSPGARAKDEGCLENTDEELLIKVPGSAYSGAINCNVLQELFDDSVQKSMRDDQNLVLLPKQLWSSLKEREDGQTCCGVGWLLDQGQAITSKCIFSPDAGLKGSHGFMTSHKWRDTIGAFINVEASGTRGLACP